MADFRPKIVKTPLQLDKLALSAPCPSAQGKYSKLIWNISTAKNGMNPRIVVYTNDPSEANERHRGQISANLDLPAFYAMLQLLYKLADADPETVLEPYILQNSNFTFPGGKRSAEPSVVTELRFGRDKAGVCWISVLDVTNQNRPKIKFEFMPSRFHKFINRAGEELSKQAVSAATVKGYVKILENMLTQIAVSSFDPEFDPKAEQNNTQDGSYQKNEPAPTNRPMGSDFDVEY